MPKCGNSPGSGERPQTVAFAILRLPEPRDDVMGVAEAPDSVKELIVERWPLLRA